MIDVAVQLKQKQYCPGDELEGNFRVSKPPEKSTIELSVLWRTEGKGSEDVGVILSHRWSSDQQPLNFEQPHAFGVRLPRSPLSYDGELIKIRWLARVRVRWGRSEEKLAEVPFQLAPPLGVKS
jgi:hypothetical protein